MYISTAACYKQIKKVVAFFFVSSQAKGLRKTLTFLNKKNAQEFHELKSQKV